MSDCCSNPRVGDSGDNIYNPEEVRLYGRSAGSIKLPLPASSTEFIEEEVVQDIKSEIERSKFLNGKIEPTDESAVEILRITANSKLLTLARDFFSSYSRQVFVLIANANSVCTFPIEINFTPNGSSIVSIGVIYGYAYEGHCYKLPKPQIMCIPAEAEDIVGDQCGCDCGYSKALGYSVWRVDKLSRAIALDIRSDDIKTLILEANTPGSRSPLAYAQAQALAPHRPRE